MNLYQATAYIRHRLMAKGTAGHGIHSPLIYNLLTTVIRNRTDDKIVRSVEALRKELLGDNRFINVTDLGSGSLKHKSLKRCISDIARYSALTRKQAALLARIAKGSEPGARGADYVMLELGTSLGMSALSLALALPHRKVITVEGCPELASIAAANLERYGAGNAAVVNMEFTPALEMLKEKGLKVFFAFIDGNHRGEALKSYVRTLLEMGDEMLIVADDIHLSHDMYRGWKDIVESGLVDATMETKRFGILFQRASLTPGKYRIWC